MTKEELIQKLCSRKFWMAVAAFLASFGAGLATDNDVLTAVGAVCAALSAGIYIVVEGNVDKSRVQSETTTTTKTVTAQATDKATVQAALGAAEKAA